MAKKQMKRAKFNTHILLIISVLIVVIVIVFIFTRTPVTKAGLSYLNKQANLSIDDISMDLKEIKKGERKKAVQDGKMNAAVLIDDFVFYGDSRVMGFINYGYYDSSRIFAGSGNSLANVDDWNEALSNIKPSNVIISYGINDLGLQWDISYEGGYGKMLTDKMELIRTIDPDCNIYVCEIIPCAPYRLEEAPNWKDEPEYNKKLTAACEAFDNCTIVHTAELANGGNADIYSGDGVHFSRYFYDIWIQAIADVWQD